MPITHLLVTATAVVGTPPAAPAEVPFPPLAERAVLSYAYRPDARLDAVAPAMRQEESADDADEVGSGADWELPPPPPFGEAGSTRWYFQFGHGREFNDADDHLSIGGLGLTHFIDHGISLNFELNVGFFNQRGEDGGGGNFNLLFRWHFFREAHWTVYLDGGAGLLYTNEDVPPNGSKFNFTPQAGLGLSLDLGEDLRLLAGVRWHHISNADLFDDNPGRDSIMGYAALSIPF